MVDHTDDLTLSEWLATRLIAALVLVATSIGAWQALLGWDDRRDPDGTGPYETWQVALLVGILGVPAAAAGRVGVPLVAILFMPLSLGFAAFRDWGQTDDSGLFVIGVSMVTGGAFVGVACAAGLGALLRPRPRRTAAH